MAVASDGLVSECLCANGALAGKQMGVSLREWDTGKYTMSVREWVSLAREHIGRATNQSARDMR
eukprot:3205415-Alexandrium_andersonii.AAC.1